MQYNESACNFVKINCMQFNLLPTASLTDGMQFNLLQMVSFTDGTPSLQIAYIFIKLHAISLNCMQFNPLPMAPHTMLIMFRIAVLWQ